MSGNYQSRVFTFISKRTNRLKDTCAQGFRQIKVAVVWSGQILLYPLQLLAEKVKIFQPQLTPPPQQRSLPQPVSDINIEQALELIADAGHPIELAQKPGSLQTTARKNLPPEVSRNRGLQLTNQNSSNLGYYDPDTDDWEIASYSPRQSSQVTAKKPTIRGLSSLLVDRRLVLVTIENDLLDILSISQQQEIRRRMGIDLAITWHQWHTAKLTGEHLPQQLSTTLTSSQQLAIAASDENPSAPNLFDLLLDQPRQRLHHWWQSFTSESPAAPNPQPETQQLRQLSAANYSFTPQPPSINRFLELPQLPPITEDLPSSTPDIPIVNRVLNLQPDWFKQWVNSCREYLYIRPNDDHQIVHQPAEFELTTLETKPRKNRVKEDHNSSDLIFTEDRNKQEQKYDRLSHQIDPSLEYYQDWIEADSELIGYSQSPLSKLLAWFDQIILRIENWLIKLWHIITNRLARTESK